jgi:hypothetical protein
LVVRPVAVLEAEQPELLPRAVRRAAWALPTAAAQKDVALEPPGQVQAALRPGVPVQRVPVQPLVRPESPGSV